MSYMNVNFNQLYKELLKTKCVLVPCHVVSTFAMFVENTFGEIVFGGAISDDCQGQYLYID